MTTCVRTGRRAIAQALNVTVICTQYDLFFSIVGKGNINDLDSGLPLNGDIQESVQSDLQLHCFFFTNSQGRRNDVPLLLSAVDGEDGQSAKEGARGHDGVNARRGGTVGSRDRHLFKRASHFRHEREKLPIEISIPSGARLLVATASGCTKDGLHATYVARGLLAYSTVLTLH